MNRRQFIIGQVGAFSTFPHFALANDSEVIHFEHLYKNFGVRGYEFSARLKNLVTKTVSITGYMAPPLKAESKFFVLTREPLAICPFCQSDADWPLDIIVIYLKNMTAMVSAGSQIQVTGTLEMGSHSDNETGFVSQLRIVDASFRKMS